MTDRRFDLELAAGAEAEPDLVVGRETDPAIAGDASHGRESAAP